MKIQIKKEYQNTVVGFNDSGKPLGQRDDLYLLAEMALRTDSPGLKKLFVKLPTLKQIQKYKADIFLQQNKPVEKPEENKPELKTEESPEVEKKQSKTESEVEPKSENKEE